MFVFVNMPNAEVTRPSLALGILKAVLAGAGHSARVIPGNLRFFEAVGPSAYNRIVQTAPPDMVGEWVFAQAAFPDHSIDDAAFFELVRTRDARLGSLPAAELEERFRSIRDAVPEYLDALVDEVLTGDPVAVGCTSMFQQRCASLALLRRVKETRPSVTTLMGGANCETVMGRATHRAFPWVDYVVSGEAEEVLVPLYEGILESGPSLAAERVPLGVFAPVHRALGYPSVSYGDGLPRGVIDDLSVVPLPDFDDYFSALRASPNGQLIIPGVPFETSRGCWWGEKHHCTFCGLNGGGMDYRSHPPERALADIDALHARYGVDRLEAVDNILSMGYFDTLVPALAERRPKLNLFYETKANLKDSHVRALADAGVTWIQPGIESMHSEILRLMRKGTTATQNVKLLRACAQYGVTVAWAIIANFPGEEDDWYFEMADWLPAIQHLRPGGLTALRFDRFSPYFADPARWDLSLTPAGPIRELLPVPPEEVAEHSYFFDERSAGELVGDLSHRTALERPGLEALRVRMTEWRRAYDAGASLEAMVEDGAWQIRDTREVASAAHFEVRGVGAAVLSACEAGPLRKRLAGLVGEHAVSEDGLTRVVGELLERRLLVSVDGRLTTVVLRSPFEPQPHEIQFPGGSILRPEFFE